MINPLHKDIITNAIRVLRARRVRPNLKKIAWLVQREHSLTEKTLLTLIENLVESKDILRVHFKGGISYRIPPTSPENSFGHDGPVAPNRDVSSESDSDVEFDSGCASRGRTDGSNTSSTRPPINASRTNKGKGTSVERHSSFSARSAESQRSSPVGSAPRPRLHAGPQLRVSADQSQDSSGAAGRSSISETRTPSDSKSSGGTDRDANSRINDTQSGPLGISDTRDSKGRPSISDTISRVILGDGGGVPGGSGAPRNGGSPPTVGSEVDSHEGMEFETPCAPPRAGVRGARRGRPPLSSLGLPEARRPRQLSSRPKRAKRVYDPSEGGIVELLQTGDCPSSQYQPTGGATPTPTPCAYTTPPSEGRSTTCGGGGGGGYPCASKRRAAAASSSGGFYSNGDRVCDICQADSGASDEFLLRCCSCPATGHPSCLGYSAVLAERSRKQPWTCMDCKHCTVCNMDHLMGTLIFCDECDRAFHLTCHHPPLHTQPLGTWVCCYCSGHSAPLHNGHDASNCNSSSGGGFPLTPRDSPIPGDEESRSSGSWGGAGGGSSGFDPSIPNATHWTVEEVVAHFVERGFEESAQSLRDQAIDGSAVLLLSRADVLTSLGLKLGPALKLYRHVRVLQTRLPNPPLHT